MSQWVTIAGWADSPHLTEKAKSEIANSIPPYLFDAMTKGWPVVGSGAIYPIAESAIRVPDFPIPEHWPKAYGMDVGWDWTAATFFAKNTEEERYFLYACYKEAKKEAGLHAAAIRAYGSWLPGFIDPSANGRAQPDGIRLLKVYRDLGLQLSMANRAVEGGLEKVRQMLVSGALKIFESCEPWFDEYRNYRRDMTGNVVKKNDHCMDCCVVGETKVITSVGAIEIKDLIGRNGLVLSRGGSWARFCGARKTIRNAQTVKLRFVDDSEVICTPDHPFLTPDGWARADTMFDKACYNVVAQCIHAKQAASLFRLLDQAALKLSPFLRPVRSFRKHATIFAGSIFSAMACGSIGLFGRLQMIGASQPDLIFTTTTPTEATINLRTLNSSRDQSILAAIKRDMVDRLLRRQLKPQEHGTPQWMAGGGIGSIMRRLAGGCSTKPRNSPVSSAEKCSERSLPERTDSAQITVGADGATRLVWMMRNVIAWLAAEFSWRTAIKLSKPAPKDAHLLRCLSVEPDKKHDVYCLTVPGTSCFAISTGAVVHNTKYWALSGMSAMRLPGTPKEGTESEREGRYSPGSWMI